MAKWALIINAAVNEITDADPAGRYHPSLEWVPCGDQVAIGWTSVEGVLTAPPEKSKAELKAEELLALAATYKSTMATLQLSWLTASVNDGTTEIDKKAQVVADIATAKAQYLSAAAAIKLKYA